MKESLSETEDIAKCHLCGKQIDSGMICKECEDKHVKPAVNRMREAGII